MQNQIAKIAPSINSTSELKALESFMKALTNSIEEGYNVKEIKPITNGSEITYNNGKTLVIRNNKIKNG